MNLFNAHVADEYHTKIVIVADISNNDKNYCNSNSYDSNMKMVRINLLTLQNKYGL